MKTVFSQYEDARVRALFWDFRAWANAYAGAMNPDSLARYAAIYGIDADTVLRATAQVKAERTAKQHKGENDECKRRALELIAREKSEGKVYGSINASIGPFAGQLTAVVTHPDPEAGDLAEIADFEKSMAASEAAKDAPNHDAKITFEAGCIWYKGRRAPLAGKGYSVLKSICESRRGFKSRADLRAEIWEHDASHIDDGTINAAVSDARQGLREVLGTPGDPCPSSIRGPKRPAGKFPSNSSDFTFVSR